MASSITVKSKVQDSLDPTIVKERGIRSQDHNYRKNMNHELTVTESSVSECHRRATNQTNRPVNGATTNHNTIATIAGEEGC